MAVSIIHSECMYALCVQEVLYTVCTYVCHEVLGRGRLKYFWQRAKYHLRGRMTPPPPLNFLRIKSILYPFMCASLPV